jgi:hypothetical protein
MMERVEKLLELRKEQIVELHHNKLSILKYLVTLSSICGTWEDQAMGKYYHITSPNRVIISRTGHPYTNCHQSDAEELTVEGLFDQLNKAEFSIICNRLMISVRKRLPRATNEATEVQKIVQDTLILLNKAESQFCN